MDVAATLTFSLARSRTKSRTGKIVRDHGPVRARFVVPPYDLVVPPYDLVVPPYNLVVPPYNLVVPHYNLVVPPSEHPGPVRDLALDKVNLAPCEISQD